MTNERKNSIEQQSKKDVLVEVLPGRIAIETMPQYSIKRSTWILLFRCILVPRGKLVTETECRYSKAGKICKKGHSWKA